jgi:hypothetical protein
MKASLWAATAPWVVIVAIASVDSAPVRAATVILTATDAGFVTEAGGSAKGDGTIAPGATYNYSAGRELHYATGDLGPVFAPMDRKNYFVFDLTGIPAAITSATLIAYAGPTAPSPFPVGAHGYESLDATEMYGLAATADMAGALADAAVLKTGNTIGPGVFDDPGDPLIGMAAALYAKLASGPVPLAAKTFSPADDGTMAPLPFTPAGVMFLNMFTGAPVILGGKVVTAPPPVFPQSVFGFTGPDLASGTDPLAPKLEVTFVPEPGAVGLMGIGVAWLVGVSRRQGR